MTTLLVYLLTVHLQTGDYVVPLLPTLAECNRLGQLQTIGFTKATWDCKQYTSVVAPAAASGSASVCQGMGQPLCTGP